MRVASSNLVVRSTKWFRSTEEFLAPEETRSVEFKQAARWNVTEQRKNKTMEEVIVKTVVGFLNGQGGTLLIGVTDAREPIHHREIRFRGVK